MTGNSINNPNIRKANILASEIAERRSTGVKAEDFIVDSINNL
ncbi:hypothetical protein GCM10009123_09740 [Kangiella japonica]|uniref:Uncharacterized protein n=1 Tax=Kangiella japonica TaxID=647384 RepID=A0ABN0SX14_9GAMM